MITPLQPFTKKNIFNFLGNHTEILGASGLIVIASVRLSLAIICTLNLIWVYCFCTIAVYVLAHLLPKKDTAVVFIFLSSFSSGLFLLVLLIINPFLGMLDFPISVLVPILYSSQSSLQSSLPATKEISNSSTAVTLPAVLSRAFFESASIAILIIAISLIRETLGYGTLTLPGGSSGIFSLFTFRNANKLAIQVFSVSGGVLILLGYIFALLKYITNRIPKDKADSRREKGGKNK
jgi:hypothetical protein